ncbi:uncharacterized protein LOC141659881 [Apium graveolens]|uniref:uncharacterized protein LOC141659881 n=1 Tax=Apium graveolens TaxID=4045 RepID=UPI003D7B5AC5
MLLNEERVVPKLKQEGEIRKVELNLWYLDNGASNHMTGDKMKFNELNEQVTGQVKFGDGSMVKIEGKGSIMFKCKNGEERTLREVYYIPSLCNNIISIGQLSEEGNKTVFNGDLLWVHDKEGKLLMKVKSSVFSTIKWCCGTTKQKCGLHGKELSERNENAINNVGEAVRHSVYILNRLPTRALSGKTLYEAWTGEKPNIDHIRVFSCTSHMKIPSVYTKKLDDRNKSVVYLGKEPGTKAHRLYDPVIRKLHVSRDITFEEKKA